MQLSDKPRLGHSTDLKPDLVDNSPTPTEGANQLPFSLRARSDGSREAVILHAVVLHSPDHALVNALQ